VGSGILPLRVRLSRLTDGGGAILSPACEAKKGKIKTQVSSTPAAKSAAKLSQSLDSLGTGGQNSAFGQS